MQHVCRKAAFWLALCLNSAQGAAAETVRAPDSVTAEKTDGRFTTRSSVDDQGTDSIHPNFAKFDELPLQWWGLLGHLVYAYSLGWPIRDSVRRGTQDNPYLRALRML